MADLVARVEGLQGKLKGLQQKKLSKEEKAAHKQEIADLKEGIKAVKKELGSSVADKLLTATLVGIVGGLVYLNA